MTFELQFEYDYPIKVVYDWWTDLSGVGYVGKALKSIKPIGRDGEKILVETKWRIMGRAMTLSEKLSLFPEDHWVWEPHILGIDIIDDFTLKRDNEKTVLTIRSKIYPRGFRGRIMNLIMGRMLKKMMIDEWKAASNAMLHEIGPIPSGGLKSETNPIKRTT